MLSILGLDINTKHTGVAIVTTDCEDNVSQLADINYLGVLHDCKYVDMNSFATPEVFTSREMSLIEVGQQFVSRLFSDIQKPDMVIIEQPLKYMGGKSSADVVIALNILNYTISHGLVTKFGYIPNKTLFHANALAARPAVFGKGFNNIDVKIDGCDNIKDKVYYTLLQRLPKLRHFTSDQSLWKKTQKPQDSLYDITDAIVMAAFGLRILANHDHTINKKKIKKPPKKQGRFRAKPK